MMRRPGASAEQGGVVLVWAALLALALFGMVAVNVDLGFLRLTRQQMEGGAEVAALEGIRWRDLAGDSGRRAIARDALGLVFDDNLDPTDGDPVGFGAGPVVNLVGGQGPMNASAELVVDALPQDRVWKPAAQMELNLGNEQHGDLVAGAAVLGGGPSLENSAFVRNDFVPAPPGSTPAELQQEDAFLVRLRRASAANPLDRQLGASSAGPALPFLFGLGGAMQPGAPGDYNPRAEGLTVRATAVAATERALHVSAQADGSLVVPNLALLVDGTKWDSVLPGAPAVILDLDAATGLLTDSGTGEEWGVVLDVPARSVGSQAVPSAAAPALPAVATVIVPVYADPALTGGVRLIAGFTLANMVATATAVGVQRLPGGVLPTGATVHGGLALAARSSLSLDPALAAARASFIEPVLAPRLVR